MRLRNITGCREKIKQSEYLVEEPATYRGKWRELFGNSNPLFIEIGMGKGKFIVENAELHPEINYIGIEKYSAVLLRAEEKTVDLQLQNLKFIRMDAVAIEEVFAPGEVNRIYLNFSDPWPKDRHAKRRLPSKEFLARYKRILEENGSIEFKTDNQELFRFALAEVCDSAFVLTACTFDLHKESELNEGNVMTEYEERFSAAGNPICKYILEQKKM